MREPTGTVVLREAGGGCIHDVVGIKEVSNQWQYHHARQHKPMEIPARKWLLAVLEQSAATEGTSKSLNRRSP